MFLISPSLINVFLDRIQGGNADPCQNNPCNNGGTCLVVGDTFQCNCPPGFRGPRCDGKSMVDVFFSLKDEKNNY